MVKTIGLRVMSLTYSRARATVGIAVLARLSITRNRLIIMGQGGISIPYE
jgi:hypothetical protein